MFLGDRTVFVYNWSQFYIDIRWMFWLLWVLVIMGYGYYGLWVLAIMGSGDYGLWVMSYGDYGFWLLWVMAIMGYGDYGLWLLWLIFWSLYSDTYIYIFNSKKATTKTQESKDFFQTLLRSSCKHLWISSASVCGVLSRKTVNKSYPCLVCFTFLSITEIMPPPFPKVIIDLYGNLNRSAHPW